MLDFHPLGESPLLQDIVTVSGGVHGIAQVGVRGLQLWWGERQRGSAVLRRGPGPGRKNCIETEKRLVVVRG